MFSTKSYIQIIIIISFISFSFLKSIEIYKEIKKDFYYCKSKTDLLNIDNMCESSVLQNISESFECINDLKKLKTEILDNNQFIETKHYNKVIYLSNGEYFKKNCQKVERVYIAQIFDKCTKDIFLYFYTNGIKTFGFLSTYGTIKDTSIEVECSEGYSKLQIDNFQFIKNKNMVKVDNLLPISKALQRRLDAKLEEKVADLMISSFNKETRL
jgi:hypothetical protein